MNLSILKTRTAVIPVSNTIYNYFRLPADRLSLVAIPPKISNMSSVARAEDLSIETTDIKTAEGIELSPRQKILVGGVLDVGTHSFQHLSFTNTLTLAASSSKANLLLRSFNYGLKMPHSTIL